MPSAAMTQTTHGNWRPCSLILAVSLSLSVLTCLLAAHHPGIASLTNHLRGVLSVPANSPLPPETSCVHCAQHVHTAPPPLQASLITHASASHPFPVASRFTIPAALVTAVTPCMSGLGSALCQLVAVLLVVVGWIVHRSRQHSTALAYAAPQSPCGLRPAALGTSSRVTCVQFRCLRN